ncbi:alkylated DNA repair protein ALKBH8 homolog isoform X2 [Dendrobium catenatum]|uniref:alkylated DNA repair protein ALKBH8 homolog isoform X2 n=1 Tax=Dendrobium catenatum TaxID=906689 RepID=UPI00109F45A0|nr:alkylated DNA repair protein ALKBH8 homolog isoform X2 [Dendrobium catenatum]
MQKDCSNQTSPKFCRCSLFLPSRFRFSEPIPYPLFAHRRHPTLLSYAPVWSAPRRPQASRSPAKPNSHPARPVQRSRRSSQAHARLGSTFSLHRGWYNYIIPKILYAVMDLNLSRFTNPKGSSCSATQNLYVANCGPAVGISFEDIKSVFSIFGEVVGIHAADDSGTRVIVCYSELIAAKAAFETLNGCRCGALGGRILHIRYSILQPPPKVNINDSLSVSLLSSELAIPGIFLVHDFITSEEEQELLAAVDSKPWNNLSKRRVQHYGYEFLYQTRNVDTKQFLGELPPFVSPIIEKISSFQGISENEGQLVDQLTVNDYPPGIGLSPHIDTHSAFDDMIFSLSLAGPCIMEFRKYSLGSCHSRKAIFLPPRSMLLLSGEGRYGWHHYIPHHKGSVINHFPENILKKSKKRKEISILNFYLCKYTTCWYCIFNFYLN